MEIGIYRSATPLSLSCLSIPRCSQYTYILAVDKYVMVLASSSHDDRHCYFVYDSVQGSFRMIPLPEDIFLPSGGQQSSPHRATWPWRVLLLRPRPPAEADHG